MPTCPMALAGCRHWPSLQPLVRTVFCWFYSQREPDTSSAGLVSRHVDEANRKSSCW